MTMTHSSPLDLTAPLPPRVADHRHSGHVLATKAGKPCVADFPILSDGLVYLDSAATSLKPRAVISAVQEFYETSTGAISRAGHAVSERATEKFEDARARIAAFVGTQASHVIFTHNTSDAIMRVVEGLTFDADDEVIVSVMEHHSNLLPWRRVARVVPIGISAEGTVDLAALQNAISGRTRLIAMTAASNVSGVVQPVAEICEIGRRAGVPVLIDAAQVVGHLPFSVADVGSTFCAMSGHKMLGPSGTGVLALSDEGARLLRPARPGGGTVEFVGPDTHTEKVGPEAYEMGSPNPEGVFGLAAAVTYLDQIGVAHIADHVGALRAILRNGIAENPAFDLAFADGHENTGIVTFTPRSRMDVGLMGQILSETYGVALRHGHHCAQPFYSHTGTPPALRASLHLYNTQSDVDTLLGALRELSPFCTA